MDALTAMKDLFSMKFGILMEYIFYGTNQIHVIRLACIALGIFVLIIVILNLVLFCCRAKNKYHLTAHITTICTGLFGCSAFILSILLIVFLALNYVVGGFCDYSIDVLKDPKLANEYKVHFPKAFHSLLSTGCVEEKGLFLYEFGRIKNPALTENLKKIGDFLDGLSYYDNFLKDLKPDKNLNALTTQSKEWEEFKSGLKPNFANVQGNFCKYHLILRLFVMIKYFN